MAWNISNILVNEAIANKKAGSGSDLTSRVTALEETVGDESSGLVKDVSDLETTVETLDANVYSANEVKIGKWDNSDLYRKKYTIAALGNNTTVTIDLDISNVTFKKLYGITTGIISGNSYSFPLPYAGSASTNSIEISIDNTQSKINIASPLDLTAFSAELIVEYTKNPAPESNSRKKK